MRITMKFEGGREMENALRALPRATAKAVVRRILKAAGQPIADHARRIAPNRNGHLAKSITVGTKIAGGNAGRQAFGAALRAGASRAGAQAAARAANRAGSRMVEMFIGPGRHPQAIQQEFGNQNHGAQPFMRPAWNAEKENTLTAIKDSLWAEILKATARYQRKLARAAR